MTIRKQFGQQSLLLLSALCISAMLSSCNDDDSLTMRRVATATHNDVSKLCSQATYELGVGFSYDLRADYGKGVRYQIFDIQGLDVLQNKDKADYICDDEQRTSEQQVEVSDSESDLTTKIYLAGSIGLSTAIDVGSITVSGSYSQTDIESRKYTYGIMRVKESLFTRELQYDNVAASAAKSASGYFTPVFRQDWERLQAYNSSSADQTNLASDVKDFLNRWGIAFVCRSSMGGYLEYRMTIEKAYLTNGMSVQGALKAEFTKMVQAKAEVNYEKFRRQISGHYTEDITAYGGDVQLVSIINNTDSLSNTQFKKWTDSFVFGQGMMKDNCVLCDLKLASISCLFTGVARKEIERQMNEYKL